MSKLFKTLIAMCIGVAAFYAIQCYWLVSVTSRIAETTQPSANRAAPTITFSVELPLAAFLPDRRAGD